jgi:hypothetical protein
MEQEQAQEPWCTCGEGHRPTEGPGEAIADGGRVSLLTCKQCGKPIRPDEG